MYMQHEIKCGFRYLVILMLAALGVACTPPPRPQNLPPSQTSIAVPPATFTLIPATAPAPLEHRIRIRMGASGMEFYDRQTGDRFIPRGGNYHRWVDRISPSQGVIQIDALFNTEDGQVDQAEADLQQMAALGFNTVRVWKNACWGGVKGCIGDPRGGLSSAYLDNIAEFLRMAKRNGIYVIFTDDWVPDDGGYSQVLNGGCCSTFDGYNNVYLTKAGIAAEGRYWEDFIHGLIERGAPLDAVLAYELKNEAFYEAQLPPFNRTSGAVTTANGQTYEMGDQKDRRRMMEDGWLFWSQSLRDLILAIDHTALVTMGFFVQQEPHPARVGDTRLVFLARMIHESRLDFLDFHAYPGYDLDIQEHAENFDMIGAEDKLIIMGEFGADKKIFPLPDRAAAVLQAWQVDSCKFGFDGWMLWTWGNNPHAEYWNAADAGGLVATVLSPARRPDPCRYGDFDFLRYNAAAGAAITASSSVSGYPPENVADGTEKYWNSARPAPQWVELALKAPVDVESIILTVAQNPSGRSVHEIWVRQAGGKLALVHTFDGVTSEGQVLTFKPDQPLTNVDLVRVVTTTLKDLWPAWHEIEILTLTPPG